MKVEWNYPLLSQKVQRNELNEGKKCVVNRFREQTGLNPSIADRLAQYARSSVLFFGMLMRKQKYDFFYEMDTNSITRKHLKKKKSILGIEVNLWLICDFRVLITTSKKLNSRGSERKPLVGSPYRRGGLSSRESDWAMGIECNCFFSKTGRTELLIDVR